MFSDNLRKSLCEGPSREIDLAIHTLLWPRWIATDYFKYNRDDIPCYTSSHDDSMLMMPHGFIQRRYVAGTLVPHEVEISRGATIGGYIGNSDVSSILAMCDAVMDYYQTQ